MKRFIRWLFDDYPIGFWAGGAYWTWGLTWKTVAVTLCVMVGGAFIQGLVEE